MNHRRHIILIAVIACCLIVLIVLPGALPVAAKPANGYELSWYTIDGGGAMNSTGGAYALGGTIGQPDAGALSGTGYTLSGGFWYGAGGGSALYLPLILR